MRVLLLESIHEDALELLMDAVEISFADRLDAESVASAASDCQAIVTRGTGRIPASVLRANPQLRCVARCGAGVDNIDVAEATALGLPVVYAPGASTQSVAEHAIMLALAAARRASQWDQLVKAGNWQAREGARGLELAGRRLGILGLGKIGRRTAEIGNAIGMEVVYWSPQSRDDRFTGVGLDELLRQSDVLSLHAPLTEETRGMLGHIQLEGMKPGSLLVNTARGALLDEEALYRALTEGPLAAAGLDVLAVEPPPSDHPLLQLNNVIFSPHIAGITDVAFRRMSVVGVTQLLRILQDKQPDAENIVNWNALQARGR
jgi:phosphoglycerate dehydrogenase-like enzyme